MTGRVGRALRLLAVPRALVMLALCVVATFAVAGLLATSDDSGAEPADRAFLDSRATAELVSATTTLVGQVFSVDPRKPKVQERLISDHLGPDAESRFRELYAPYLAKKSAGVTLQTTATSVGVIRLSGDEAEVLVVADQRASAPDGRANAGTANIRLTLSGGTGAWRITAIDAL